MVPEALVAFRQAINVNPDYAAAHRALEKLLLYQARRRIDRRTRAPSNSNRATLHSCRISKGSQRKGLTQKR